MPIRLIAADMDDTLLNDEGQLTERTIRALERAKQAGAYIVLASGRMVESMLPAAGLVRPNAPIIAYNGGAVYDLDERRVTHQTPVEVGSARELLRLAEQLGVHAQAFLDGGYVYEQDNDFSRAYAVSAGVTGRAVHMPLSEYVQSDPFKILLIASEERIAELLPVFRERFQGRVNCVNSKMTFIECIAPGIDKGEALLSLARDLGVQRHEILAFGDGQNDLEMLNMAGLGYAMANAKGDVKRRAPHIAPSNEEDGVAQIVEQLLADGQIGGTP